MSSAITEAAKKHDWECCKFALHDRLSQTEPSKSAKLCLDYFILYMPRFRENGNGEEWLTIRVKEIQGSKLFSDSGSELPPFPDMNVKQEDAISRTIKWALFYFWSGARFYTDSQIRTSNLSEAIASMIMVFRREHPHWTPKEYAVEVVRLLDSQGYGKMLWTTLSDKLEKAE